MRHYVMNTCVVWYRLSSYELREGRNLCEWTGPAVRAGLELELTFRGEGRIETHGEEKDRRSQILRGHKNPLKAPL